MLKLNNHPNYKNKNHYNIKMKILTQKMDYANYYLVEWHFSPLALINIRVYCSFKQM